MQHFAFPTTEVSHLGTGPTVKSSRELELMQEAGWVVAHTLGLLRSALEPGIRTRELDALAEREIRGQGALPAFKGYRGFPATLCVSVNQQVVHGIPGDRMIRDGDIVSMDLGAIVDGLYGDAAVTVAVGDVPEEVRRLLRVTEEGLMAGVQAVRPGNRIGDVSAAVQASVERQGSYGIVREYVGHGIGRALHEEPQVPNYGVPGRGPLLRTGMVLAIEPMVNLGGAETRLLEDGWTVETADGSLSAHFEHSVAVTDGDPIIITRI